MEGEAHIRRGRFVYREGDLSTEARGGDLSVEGETRPRMWRLVYRGSDSPTEGKTRLRRRDLSTEEETREPFKAERKFPTSFWNM
jgi:hypothetical protein